MEQVAFQFIDDSFSSLKSVSNALDLVVRLQSTSQDEGQHNLLQKHMSTKIEKIITQYCQELQRSLDEFNQ